MNLKFFLEKSFYLIGLIEMWWNIIKDGFYWRDYKIKSKPVNNHGVGSRLNWLVHFLTHPVDFLFKVKGEQHIFCYTLEIVPSNLQSSA